MDNKYVLAMYDVRGKQEFIFRTNKLQEIVGGSWIIRDIFKDYLYPAAEKVSGSMGIYSYKDNSEEEGAAFTPVGFEAHLSAGYVGEVVYDGGGNFLVVFESEETFKRITYEFTKNVMEAIGSLRILATCVNASAGFLDYVGDRDRLYAKHRIAEANESMISPWSAIPIVQVDRKVSQPLIYTEHSDRRIASKGLQGKLTKESNAKLDKFFKEYDRVRDPKNMENLSEVEREFSRMNEDILDNIVEEKGKDSNLAVVYIDGNSMGAKVRTATKDMKTYEKCSDALREFSQKIQKTYVDDGVKHALESIDVKNDEAFRIVVSAGDEINFIVKARDAFKCAKSYLDYLAEEDNDSACAGIAVFHSHAPYADAYRLAEEACESGKKKMKKLGLKNASFIDFHIIQGAIGTSLEDIRESENGEMISRPWMMWNKDEIEVTDVTDYEKVKTIVETLDKYFSRTNIKGLAQAAKLGDVELTMELNRMYAHLSDKKKKDLKISTWNNMVKKEKDILYDIAVSYDLWFSDKKNEKGGDGK